MIEIIFQLLFLIIAVEAATEIIVAAKITDGIRDWIRNKAISYEENVVPVVTLKRRFWIFVDALLSCGYCSSVWVAMFFGFFAPYLIIFWQDYFLGRCCSSFVNWLVVVMILHRGSNWFHVFYMLVKNGRVRTYDIELKQNVIVEVKYGSVRQSEGEGITEIKAE